MDSELSFTVSGEQAGSRLDRFVAQQTHVSRAVATRLIEDGQVRVGQKRGRKGMVLLAGEVVHLQAAPQDPLTTPPPAQPELPLSVLYEDPEVVAINKPAGMPSHPLRAGETGTAASALLGRYPECAMASEHPREGGLCHRLDIFTSGVLLAARNRQAWLALRAAFREGQVDKEYLALVQGVPLSDSGKVDLPLLPAPGRSDRMVVAEDPDLAYQKEALDAETHFVVERRGPGCTLLRVTARTGRRHQVRAHLSYLGLPLYGDALYGGPPLPDAEQGPLQGQSQGQFLHAAVLRFPSPGGPQGEAAKRIEVHAPLPPARQRILESLLSP